MSVVKRMVQAIKDKYPIAKAGVTGAATVYNGIKIAPDGAGIMLNKLAGYTKPNDVVFIPIDGARIDFGARHSSGIDISVVLTIDGKDVFVTKTVRVCQGDSLTFDSIPLEVMFGVTVESS